MCTGAARLAADVTLISSRAGIRPQRLLNHQLEQRTLRGADSGPEELRTISGSWPRLSLAQVGATPGGIADTCGNCGRSHLDRGRAISLARGVRAVFTALSWGIRHKECAFVAGGQWRRP